jgi:tetratricopeptide (TPR) repeat protein
MNEPGRDPHDPPDPTGAEQVNRIDGTVEGNVVQARDIANLHIHASREVLPVPRQVPSVGGAFVNRFTEVDRLDRMTARPEVAGAPPVVVLTGGHGVGKTATSRHWAHSNVSRFDDGQLYADFSELRHRGGIAVGDVLGGFLRAFGIAEEVIPIDLAERAALFRSSTAGKRVLVVLDDVDHAAQVQPLIPGTADGVVLITSRSPLEELLHDGARLLRLRPLDEESAREMLAGMLGDQRVRDDPGAVEELVAICGGLPVALRVCGARLDAADHQPVSWLVDELSDEPERLGRIGLRPERSLQAVFDDGYRALAEDAATTYRRLGLYPGPSFTPAAAAAVAGLPYQRAVQALDELARANLVEAAPSRFRFHDLLRIHAGGTAERIEPEAEQAAAVERTVAFYVAAARRMDHATIANRLRLTGAPPPAGPGEPAPATASDALAWFETERPNLIAALRAACDRGWDEAAWQMGEALFLAYHNHKHYEEAREVYSLAAGAAERCGDRDAVARMRSQLARAQLDLGDHAAAEAELDASRRLVEGGPNRQLWASIMEWTGALEVARGDHRAAIAALRQSRAVFEEEGNTRGVALQDYQLGRSLTGAGEYDAAVECLRRAAQLIDPEADALTLGRILIRLGEAHAARLAHAPARAALSRAVQAMHRSDAPLYEARAHELLGQIEQQAGDAPAAIEHLGAALAIYERLRSAKADPIRGRLEELQPPAG